MKMVEKDSGVSGSIVERLWHLPATHECILLVVHDGVQSFRRTLLFEWHCKPRHGHKTEDKNPKVVDYV